jgi:glucose-6-phosphate 1-epimerase
MQVVDGARGHSVTVRRQGWPDAVVWNPWTEKAKATGDIGDEEYQVRGCTDGWVCCGHDVLWAPAEPRSCGAAPGCSSMPETPAAKCRAQPFAAE